MDYAIIQDSPRIHRTPLPRTIVDSSRIIVELDDENERRISIIFEPYQAFKVTTSDCFVVSDGCPILSQQMVEVIESSWIQELRASLKRIDNTANFLDKSRHFMLNLQDEFLEVVAWEFRFSAADATFLSS